MNILFIRLTFEAFVTKSENIKWNLVIIKVAENNQQVSTEILFSETRLCSLTSPSSQCVHWNRPG